MTLKLGISWTMPLALVTSLLALPAPAEEDRPREAPDAGSSRVEYRVIVTSGLDEDGAPIDNFDEVQLTAERIYFYVQFFRLVPEHEYSYECKILDGSGDVLMAHAATFTPEDDRYDYWCFYTPNPKIDRPGVWRLEALLDGRQPVEGSVTVLPP